jgi:hypothetical protein
MKTLISAVSDFLMTFYLGRLSKYGIPTESNKQNKKEKEKIFCWHLESY